MMKGWESKSDQRIMENISSIDAPVTYLNKFEWPRPDEFKYKNITWVALYRSVCFSHEKSPCASLFPLHDSFLVGLVQPALVSNG